MKLQNPKEIDVDRFFEAVNDCNGRVELVTEEGDRLNLKSKLSQYVSMGNIFANGEVLNLEIVVYEEADSAKLMPFISETTN